MTGKVRPIEVQLRKTYFSLRFGVATLGILLPLVLWAGGKWYGISLRPSMSAYYYATQAHPDPPKCDTADVATEVWPAGSMRNWFVGFLFAVGAMLFVNKGSSTKESAMLSLAGVFAVGIAVCPMAWGCASEGKFSPHGVFAFLFFGAIAFVCVFCADETLQYLDDAAMRRRFRIAYVFLGIMMIASPVLAWTMKVHETVDRHVFWAETWGVLSFGTYWLVKSWEIEIITRRRRARGERLAEETEAVPV